MSIEAIRLKNISKSLINKNILIIGGTSGVGMGISKRLFKNNNITIVGRNKNKGLEVISQLNNINSNHSFIQCDVTLLKNIVSCINTYKENNNKLDYLIFTQGIATTQGRTETIEGIDEKLSLHYFSRVTFMKLLLPLLNKSEDPRVISVFSAGVHKPYTDYNNDMELINNYDLSNAANACGMYNDIAVDKMSEENPNVSFIHIAPGIVKTDWGKELNFIFRGLAQTYLYFKGVTVEECAEAMCDSIYNEKFKAPGYFLLNKHAEPVNKCSEHDRARDIVWKKTNEVINRVLSKYNL